MTSDDALIALRQRHRNLKEHSARLKKRFTELGGSVLKLHIRAVYERSLAQTEAETNFVIELVSELEEIIVDRSS